MALCQIRMKIMSNVGRKLLQALQEDKSTWDLYKDKPFLTRVSKVMYTSELLDPMFKVYYSIRAFINNVKRLIEYAPIVWRHRNWDHGYVLEFNKKLYEDLYKGCFLEGNHVVESKDVKAIKAVIALFDKLHKDEYEDKVYKIIEKKYGKSKFYFPKKKDSNGREYTSFGNKRDEAMSPKQLEKMNKERNDLWKQAAKEKQQDYVLLGKLLGKYGDRFWD